MDAADFSGNPDSLSSDFALLKILISHRFSTSDSFSLLALLPFNLDSSLVVVASCCHRS